MYSLSIKKAVYIFTIAVVSMQLFGCFGGGGGGSTAPTSLVYNGNTNAAVITLDNAPTLVGNVLYSGDSTTGIPTAITTTDHSIRSGGAEAQSVILKSISQNIRENVFKTNTPVTDIAVGVNLNEPLECDNGSGNLSGTLNDTTFTGTLTFTYTNCLLDGITYNGTGTFRIDTFDLNNLEPTDVTMTFTLMSISSSEFTGSMSGTIRLQSFIASNTEKMTLNYVAKDNLTGKMYKFENIIITSVYDYIFSPNNLTQTFTGSPARSFDSLHGYVDIDTPTPLVFSSVLLINPDIDGVMLFTGAVGASIRLTVLSGGIIQLELDIDGMPDYEVLRIMQWDELKLNADTDISDTDNDGMHDSWEITNGLDPLDATDANQDADGDDYSNFDEYQSGTDPGDNSSFPSSADLSITMTDSTDPVVAGATFSYKLAVSNTGPDTAVNIHVQDALPPGLNFISATGFDWSCENLNGAVSCLRSSITIGDAPVITIMVETTSANANISNTASVSSSTIDFNSDNDSATENTAISLPATSLNLDPGAAVFDMELDIPRQLLYVSAPDLNELIIISLDTFTVLDRVVVGSSPHGIDISQDGNTLYIALNQGGAVAMLDLDTLLVSEVVVAVDLGTSLVYDVIAATSTEVFVSGNPGSSGFAYIVKIDTASNNQISRVANNRIIRANPFFVASADQQLLYVGEGFSPNSVYQLDLTQTDAPIVLEDNHGSISGSDHLSINSDGSQLFLTSGQVLRTDTLTQAGLIGRGVSIVSTDGTIAYVGTAPNSISVYDTSTFLEIDNIFTTCDITDIERIIELQDNTEWILLGQQTVCLVDLKSFP